MEQIKNIIDSLNYTNLMELDTEQLDFRLLRNKYSLDRIKPIDYKEITKINAHLWDLTRELDFWINISGFLRNCAYFNTDYTKSVISFIKKEVIEQLNFYILELEDEQKRLKVRIWQK